MNDIDNLIERGRKNLIGDTKLTMALSNALDSTYKSWLSQREIINELRGNHALEDPKSITRIGDDEFEQKYDKPKKKSKKRKSSDKNSE